MKANAVTVLMFVVIMLFVAWCFKCSSRHKNYDEDLIPITDVGFKPKQLK